MATKMWEPDAKPLEKHIPYGSLAMDLFDNTQILVPFLGAGASISEVDWPKPLQLGKPDQDLINHVCKELDLSGPAKDFLATSIRIAWQIQEGQQKGGAEVHPFDAVKNSEWPPSAGQLAAAFADISNYDHFVRPAMSLATRMPQSDPAILAQTIKWAALVSGLAGTAPPLLSVASYFSHTEGEDAVWRRLKVLFENKVKPTKVHRMVAAIAEYQVSKGSGEDYLIVTTNYDRLMEEALTLASVPHCAFVVDKVAPENEASGRVRVIPSKDLQMHLKMNDGAFEGFRESIEKEPGKCYLRNHAPPFAIVYKMHGSLYPAVGVDRNNVILTDEDYVEYMRQNGSKNSLLPAAVRNLMDGKGFLFMGYSFSDWNVRSWYTSLIDDPAARDLKDWAVMLDPDRYEDGFFTDRKINLAITELKRFAVEIMKNAPQSAQQSGAWK